MDIIELPEMEDERIKKAMLVMSSCARSAYQIKPELCVSVSAKMVNLTLQKGLAYGGSVGFLAFGPIFHGAILNNKTSGFEFGKLTLSILDKFKNKTNKAEINFVVGYFAIPWKQPATVMENYYQIAYESGIETGDLFHASCACCGMIQSYWMRGVEFNKIISIAAKYLKFLDRIKNTEAILTIESVLKTIENLQGKSKSKTSYDSIEFSEEKYIENIKTFASRHFAHYYYINKMASLYLWGEYEEGLKVSIQAENYLKDSPGMLHTAEHFFYQGLLIAAANPEKLSYKYNRLLKRIISKFKKYAADCPENFEDKYLLLQAEWAGIKKDTFVKSKLLNDAQKSAAEYKHIQIQAIASMRLADLYYKSDSKKICKIHLDEALYFLNQWGAKGVAESVAKEYFEKAGFLDLAKFSSDSLNKDQISSSLDLITIVKSTEAISSQVRFKDLIEAMISIVTENAGAERVVFILSQNDNLTIRSDNFNPDLINDSISTSYEDYYNVPHSVINYTLNTKNPVMINNAHEDEVYRHDPYITDNKLKSILCLPFLKQGKISAILYLENNLTTGAFTKERIDLLKLLSGQIAISIDNALLYDNLEEKVEFRTQELRKEKEKSENLLLNILPAEIAEELKETGTTEAKSFEQVTVLFTDIKNFSSICEHLSAEELVKEIHYFYSEFDKIIGNYNIEKIKTIGDCYMCAGGLTKSSDSAPLETVQAAMEMNQFLLKEIEKQSTSSRTSELLNMRIGLHTGPVVAGIVGIKKFAYDIWGDTVNIASRMESNGEPGKINISGNTYEYIKNNYQCTYRGKIEIKNRGLIDMYFVDREV
jgi:class 3 adenylate cyclase